MMQFKRIARGATAVATAGLSLLGASASFAAQLKSITVTPSDARATRSSSYTVNFTIPGASNLREIQLQFRQGPGTTAVPNGLTTTSGSITSVTIGGSPDADWTTGNGSSFASNGTILLRQGAADAVSANTTVSVVIAGITNNGMDPVGNLCDNVTGTESCFVSIRTYSDDAGTLVDSANATYTIIGSDGVSVTATVEPIVRFTVTGVTASAMSTITTNDSFSATGSHATNGQPVTTTPTTIPFGSVIAGIPKFAQQNLRMETNANNGYNVHVKFIGTSPNAMVGQANSSNVINSYTGTFASPTAWTGAPSGTTPNTNTGWFGVRTTDTDVANFNTNDNYAGLVISTTSLGNSYMTSSTSDDGTTSQFLTFKIMANSLQPSDTYQGIPALHSYS